MAADAMKQWEEGGFEKFFDGKSFTFPNLQILHPTHLGSLIDTSPEGPGRRHSLDLATPYGEKSRRPIAGEFVSPGSSTMSPMSLNTSHVDPRLLWGSCVKKSCKQESSTR